MYMRLMVCTYIYIYMSAFCFCVPCVFCVALFFSYYTICFDGVKGLGRGGGGGLEIWSWFAFAPSFTFFSGSRLHRRREHKSSKGTDMDP